MKLDVSSYDAAIDALVTLGLRPYWDSPTGKAHFRSIQGRGFTKQKDKAWYKGLIDVLRLYNNEAVATAREQVKRREL